MPPRKYGNASIKADVGIRNTAKKCFDESIDTLSGLVGKTGKARFQVGIYGDRGCRHRGNLKCSFDILAQTMRPGSASR
ncbi:MAG TPA: hypothetical protein VHX14_10685 [Thermoanaerobaculia bacterium]|nr:hypothetical protein [Thermoanaerobaculia bacterium]